GASYGAGREYGPSLRSFEECHVGMDVWIDQGIGCAVPHKKFLCNDFVSIRMVLAAADDQCVRRRTEELVDCIDLISCGPALEHAEIAKDLITDAIECPGNPWVGCGLHASIVAALVEALADEADPDQTLRGSGVGAPKP